MSIKIEPLKSGKSIMKFIGQNKSESRLFYKNLKTNHNDTNFACDKFFRQDELFDRKTDVVHSGYKKYSVEDIPADESSTEFSKDKVHLFSKINNFFEYREKPTILLHKDKRYFSLDKIYDINVGKRARDIVEQKLNEGFTPEQTLNVYYSGIVDGSIRQNLTSPAFRMIKNGYPIEYVVNLMERSKLRRASGQQKYPEGMLEFLEKFPYMKRNMVTINSAGEEIFDSVGAKYYPYIFDLSKNEIQAMKILRLCRLKHKDNAILTDERLARCALELLKNCSGNFSKSDFNLLKNLASIDHVYAQKVRDVYPLLCNGYDSNSIIKQLGLNLM